MTNQEMLEEFHDRFVPADANAKSVRATLLLEEHQEVQEALANGELKEIAKELADLVYVSYGTAVAYGFNLDDVIQEVHRSNMTKVGDDGKPMYRSDGKVMKGPNYRPPDLSWLE